MKISWNIHGLPLYCHLCECPIDGSSTVLCSQCRNGLENVAFPQEIFRPGMTSSQIRIFSLFDYHYSEKNLDLVSKIKFENKKALLNVLLQSIKDWSFLPNVQEIWYIPASFRKILERGYNPSKVMAKFLSKKLQVPLRNSLKKRDTLSQSSKNRADRLKIAQNNVFQVRGKVLQSKNLQRLLLVDDIVTTGATLHTVSQKILEVLSPKVEIFCLTLFHTEIRHERN